MHGVLTDTKTIEKMKETLENQQKSSSSFQSTNFELLLYTGRRATSSWFFIQISPVKNAADCTVLFLLTFKEIAADRRTSTRRRASFLRFSNFARSNFPASNAIQNQENQCNYGNNNHTRNDVEIKLKPYNPLLPTNNVATKCSVTSNKKKKKTSDIFSFSPAVLPKYYYESPQTPKHIILHYSTFKTTWDWFILSLIIYTAVFVPYHVAFTVNMKQNGGWLFADSVVDLIFIADVAINFHTTYVGQGGEVISDPQVIRTNYIRSWFIIDLLSCLPYDVIDMINYFFDQHNDESGCDLLSALKIARLLRLGHVVRKLDHYIEYGGAMLFLLVCFFGLSAHWLACIWYTIGRQNLDKLALLESNGVRFRPRNWLEDLADNYNSSFKVNETSGEVTGGPTTSQCYIASLYFTMTGLTSVGFGNIAGNTEAEQIFCVIMLIFGSLLYACIFGNITTIIQQMYKDTNRYHDRLTSVREFLKLYHVPKELSNRIMDYVVSTWSITKGIDTTQVLNYFPKDMKADICVHLGRETFTKQPAFSLASNSCLRALAVEFETTHNAPGDTIVHKGESIDKINFVVSGSLEVVQDDEVVAILSKGDVFGNTFWNNPDVLDPVSSECHVRALTYCDLYSIKKDPLTKILEFYKPFAVSFTRKMVLTFNLTRRFRFKKVDEVHRENLNYKINAQRILEENHFPDNHPIRLVIRRFKSRIRERERLKQLQLQNQLSITPSTPTLSSQVTQSKLQQTNQNGYLQPPTPVHGNSERPRSILSSEMGYFSVNSGQQDPQTSAALQSVQNSLGNLDRRMSQLENNVSLILHRLGNFPHAIFNNSNSLRNSHHSV